MPGKIRYLTILTALICIVSGSQAVEVTPGSVIGAAVGTVVGKAIGRAVAPTQSLDDRLAAGAIEANKRLPLTQGNVRVERQIAGPGHQITTVMTLLNQTLATTDLDKANQILKADVPNICRRADMQQMWKAGTIGMSRILTQRNRRTYNCLILLPGTIIAFIQGGKFSRKKYKGDQHVIGAV